MKKLILLVMLISGVAKAQTFEFTHYTINGVNPSAFASGYKGHVEISDTLVTIKYNTRVPYKYQVLRKREKPLVGGKKGWSSAVYYLTGDEIDDDETKLKLTVKILKHTNGWTKKSSITLVERDLFTETNNVVIYWLKPKHKL